MIRRLLLIGLLLVGSGAATASDNIAPENAPEATPTPDIPPDSDPGVILKEFPPGGPVNQVRLVNKKDGAFLARSAISLHRSSTPSVQPKNIAVAEGQCTDCATMAIAVQVFLYQRGASNIQPQNIALSVNNVCTRCITIALAFQYVVPVDDVGGPVPENVGNLLRDMERELRYFATVKTVAELDPYEASSRLRALANRTDLDNGELVKYLRELMDQKSDAAPRIAPSESPSPSPSANLGTEAPASPTAEPAPSESPSPSPAPTATP
jgi:hypothetical protein